MTHEIIDLQDVQIIGLSKEIPFRNGGEECPKFWGEYIKIYQSPSALRDAVIANGVGKFGLCTCKLPNHDCTTCAAVNFGTCSEKAFTYVIGGTYNGGAVPEGMKLFPIPSGKWIKVHFEGGMAAFQQQFQVFWKEWMPSHPEFSWRKNSVCMEWYDGQDIQSPAYKCGIMFPLE